MSMLPPKRDALVPRADPDANTAALERMVERGIDAINRQIDTTARLETEREKTERQRIRLAETQEKNRAAQHLHLIVLLGAILAIVAAVVAGLMLTGDSSRAVTVLTTAVIGILSLFAGKSLFGESFKRPGSGEE